MPERITKRITKLTTDQLAMLPAICDQWLAHGLSTELADRSAAEAGRRAAYRAAKLDPPRFIIWLGSPMSGAIGQAWAPAIISRYLDAQVDDQVYAQVDDQVYAQVRAQVDDQVDDQVRDQVGDQVGDQVYDQVDDQVGDQVGAQVRAQVYAQGRAQVDDQVGDQVGAQVRAQVYAQARAQVDDQVRAQVDDQVDAQVRDQVYAQVYAQVDDQVDAQVRAQVRDQVGAQVGAQVYAQVGAQVDDQVRAQVYAQVGAQVDDQVGAQVDDQVGAQVDAQVDDRLKNWYAGRIAGQHWAGWYSYFAAMAELGVKNLEPLLEGQCEVGKNAGWWWAYRGFAVVTDRPAVLCRAALGGLHAEHGPAIAYRDGWGFWAWHGRRVPRWVVESPTLEAISREDNVEIRRCAIESMGWERFTAELLTDQRPAIAPDPGNPDQSLVLHDVPEGLWGARVKLLLCTNGSTERDGTRRRYGLTVPAHLTDPVEAAGWTAGLSKDEYSRMVRRT